MNFFTFRHSMYTRGIKRGTARGFTLIETLVAIAILVTSIVVPMSIAARGLQSAYFAKEQLTAVFLAQEGVEYMRLQRDEFSIAHKGDLVNDDWYAGLPAKFDACKSAPGCGIDIRDDTVVPTCTVATSNCRLRYDSTIGASRGMYTYASGNPMTPFERSIVITPVGSNNEVLVRVTVAWQANLFSGGTKQVVMQSRIFNQYDNY